MAAYCKNCKMSFDGTNCPICHGSGNTSRNTSGNTSAKPISVGIVIVGIVVLVGFLVYTGGIQIDKENLEQSIETLPDNIQDVRGTVENLALETGKKISGEIIKNIKIPEIDFETIPFISEPIMIPEFKFPDISYEPTPTSIEESKNNILYINQIRQEKGRSTIIFDERAYDLALSRVRDVNEYDYFDHTNPFTGTCPDTMKQSFRFSSNEYLAENLAGGVSYPDSAVDLWMTSQGHRYNLLYSEHNAGATVCESGTCVFLGLNNDQFGLGCHTGDEGEAWHQGMGDCSDDDFLRLDTLNQKYDLLSNEYEKIPEMTRSQVQYQQAMKMYNELQIMYNQINNFKC